MHQQPPCLIIGIGNTLRSDDGVGAYVCARLETILLNQVDILVVQQLQTELIDQLLQYNHVIIVDAAMNISGFQFEEVQATATSAVHASHHLSIVTIKTMIETLYGKKIRFYVCGIEGIQFELGEQLSALAIANAEKAISYITTWVNDLPDQH